jgi:hypothetical protein
MGAFQVHITFSDIVPIYRTFNCQVAPCETTTKLAVHSHQTSALPFLLGTDGADGAYGQGRFQKNTTIRKVLARYGTVSRLVSAELGTLPCNAHVGD